MVQLISGVGGVSLQKAENSRVKKKKAPCATKRAWLHRIGHATRWTSLLSIRREAYSASPRSTTWLFQVSKVWYFTGINADIMHRVGVDLLVSLYMYFLLCMMHGDCTS